MPPSSPNGADGDLQETKLHRLLREARERKAQYEHLLAHAQTSATKEDLGPATDSGEAEVDSDPDDELPVPYPNTPAPVGFVVGSDGQADAPADWIADEPPVYDDPDADLADLATGTDDERDLTPEEIAQVETERIIAAGEWEKVYGIDLDTAALDVVQNSSRVRTNRSDDVLASDTWEHVDGVPWYDTPPPRRLHRCKPHSTKKIDGFRTVERCRCGASRTTDMGKSGEWVDRNSRLSEIESGRAAAGDAAKRRP